MLIKSDAGGVGGGAERKMSALKSSPLTERMLDQNAMPFISCGPLLIMFAGRISELHEKTFI